VALYDSTSLLSIFNRKAGRPSADAITPESKYQRLSESQNRVVALLAAIAPNTLYPTGAFPTLSTVDNKVFTFGSDANGYPIAPMGKTGIYPSLTAIPDAPWREGYDYMNEGTQIRIPNNNTYAGTLYWRGIVPPGDITDVLQPVLFPEAARELIVLDAVRQFAMEYDRNPGLAQNMAGEWSVAWPTWCLVWRTQFRNGGALGSWTGLGLAMTNSYGSGL
jgi:hypothetical protein